MSISFNEERKSQLRETLNNITTHLRNEKVLIDSESEIYHAIQYIFYYEDKYEINKKEADMIRFGLTLSHDLITSQPNRTPPPKTNKAPKTNSNWIFISIIIVLSLTVFYLLKQQ